jgi:hypothetical protein
MVAKNGFLLIELLISLTLAFFLVFIIAYYIIEIKKIQQEVLVRAEILLAARNNVEKIIATSCFSSVLPPQNDSLVSTIDIQFDDINTIDKTKKESFFIKNIVVEKIGKNYNRSICLCVYVLGP